ncbi:LysR substrate-binding domain-containing protein [Thaumasiovibrio subtropicus]|uniref:LysR substrate-binding domain-containing protein n=1 Tax=Thaumasiovibrio subtropicus TaxID=1891207 RepID=UPI000B35FB73|nr:LysR substrate-binding domain-containing protein [Thaumasiovibrio subtropicus]
MKERMPPLQALYYFYVAADKGSFKAAAEHLFVTAAAVSQQIRILEAWLDSPLFVRTHRKTTLTAEGETLYRHAQKGFDHLQAGVRALHQDPSPHRLAVSTHPTFAHYWIIPRISSFRTQNPDITLFVDPGNELITFQNDAIDLCVRYGHGEYPNVESHWLMDEALYPACHPSYLAKHKINSLACLCSADLIEDMVPDVEWKLWFDALGMESLSANVIYDGSQYVMESVLAAQGVALVKHSIADRFIKEGKLVRIGDRAIKSSYSYFLCAPKGHFRREKIQRFKAWIKGEVARHQQAPDNPIDLSQLNWDANKLICLSSEK